MADVVVAEGHGATGPLAESYGWARRLFVDAFESEAVKDHLFDSGHGYTIGVYLPGFRRAWKLEYAYIRNWGEGHWGWDEQEHKERWMPPEDGWRYETYSLNAFADREAKVRAMIQAIRPNRAVDG